MKKLILAFAATALLAGCSNDDNPVEPLPTIALAVSSTTPTISAGGAGGTVTITVTRSSGFTDPIALTTEGLPAGIVATFTPASLPSGTNTATLLLTAVSSQAPGSLPFIIRASGGSAQSVTQSLTVSVTAATVSGAGFSLAPDSARVSQGASGSVTVRLARTTGFTGAVAFAVDSPPAGVTATFAPVSPVAGDSTVLTLGVASTVAAGVYPLRVRSTVAGQTDSTKTLRLTVAASGSISLSATPTALTLAPGDSITTTVVVSRTAPFAGAVTIATDSTVTSGLTVRVSPASLPTGTDSARVTIVAPTLADTGTRTVRLTARGTGVASANASIVVNIRRPAAISFTTTPDSLAIVQGSSASSTLRISRLNGYTGTVTFAVDSQPAGLTGSFNGSPTTTDSAVLQVAVAAGTPVGVYSIGVRATGTGVTSVRRSIRVRVAFAGSVTISLVPDTASLVAGDSVGTLVRVTRTAPFAGTVRLALDSILPAGVTGRFAIDSLVAGTDTTRLRIITSDTLSPSTVTVGVRASGTGIASVRSTATLRVSASAGFQLSVTPAILSVGQIRTGDATVTVTRNGGYTGQVFLTVRGQPALVTAIVQSGIGTGTTGVIQFAVGGTVAEGDYPITIEATGAGAATRTTSMILRVFKP